MAASYPYVNAPGALSTFLLKLCSAFPTTVSVETLKKMGLAAQNESYIINTLQFLGFITEEGARVQATTTNFLSDKVKFAAGLA